MELTNVITAAVLIFGFCCLMLLKGGYQDDEWDEE